MKCSINSDIEALSQNSLFKSLRNNYIKGHLKPVITTLRLAFRIEINHSVLDKYEILMHELIGTGSYTNRYYSYAAAEPLSHKTALEPTLKQSFLAIQ